ncbi:MAG: hypothetical protein QF460_02305 [Candidatus Nanoarchaeia archaeon]|jgi:hypothetical protein|nr:hypothetical protein [Candidatus Nanoarchaeia archaeon]
MKDKIIEFIKENGPTLPVQVVSKIGGDSFIANAYLSDLVDKKEILQSEERIGSVPLYYLAGQEDLLKKKLDELNLSSKTARNFQKKKVVETPELESKREEFDRRLKKIEEEETHQRERKKGALEKARELIKKTVPKPRVEVLRPKVELPKPIEVRPKVVEERKVEIVEETTFSKRASEFLEKSSVEILKSENLTANSGAFIVRAPSSVGPLKFYVKLWSKKRLNKSDVAESYALALEKKMPVIILTNGTVAKTAKKYLREIGGFVRVRALK